MSFYAGLSDIPCLMHFMIYSQCHFVLDVFLYKHFSSRFIFMCNILFNIFHFIVNLIIFIYQNSIAYVFTKLLIIFLYHLSS